MAEPETVTIQLMGRAFAVPAGLTILKATEHVGHRYVRGAGCRAGFCGACATLYRGAGDYKLQPALACQKRVEEGMILTQIPFVPAQRVPFQLEQLQPNGQSMLLPSLYPELGRCLSCNACTKVCPQELDVMGYVQLALRDDLAGVTRESFDCVQCGLCAARCPADIAQHHVAQLARRVHARHEVVASAQLDRRVAEIASGAHQQDLEAVKGLDPQTLRERYRARDIEEATG